MPFRELTREQLVKKIDELEREVGYLRDKKKPKRKPKTKQRVIKIVPVASVNRIIELLVYTSLTPFILGLQHGRVEGLLLCFGMIFCAYLIVEIFS